MIGVTPPYHHKERLTLCAADSAVSVLCVEALTVVVGTSRCLDSNCLRTRTETIGLGAKIHNEIHPHL